MPNPTPDPPLAAPRTRSPGPALLAGALLALVPGSAGAQAPDRAGGPPDSLWIEVAGASIAVAPVDPAGEGPPAGGSARAPNLLRDAALLAGGTTGYALARDKHRGFILGHGSVDNVLANFRRPVRRALQGTDEDSFLTNYVAHPVTWGGIALYLKRQGYSDLGALGLSQAHSVFWEYVVEGSYTTPSGRDMVTNLVSAAAVVYGLPLLVGELFPPPGADADDAAPPSGPTLGLAPLLATGPGGPTLQLGIQLR